jgi:nucleoside permease NupC
MTAGMSTIAAGVMLAYAQMGVEAGHLLTASVLGAPAGLMIAKIMYPETEKSADFAPAVYAGADAVLAASVFHFGDLTVGEVKEAMRGSGVTVR